jgi:hypothetical protein
MTKSWLSLVLLALGSSWINAATFSVTTAADSGPGSFRQAIIDANAHPNTPIDQRDVIAFAIPGAGVQTIFPSTSLPVVTDPVIIDGYTQPGASANTNGVGAGLNTVLTVQLDGIDIPLVESLSVGIEVTSGQTVIRGLIINRFYAGLRFRGGGGNLVVGNYIGTDPLGTFAPAVDFPEDQQNLGAVLEDCSDTRIGGRDPAARNLFAGNEFGDVVLTGFGTKSNVVEGNIMGLQASGTTFLRADNAWGSGSNVRLENGASENLIGGTVPEARNVMGGMSRGIHYAVSFSVVGGEPATHNLVKGNYMGLDVTGTKPTDSGPSQGGGIVLKGHFNVIGGTEPGARNIISGGYAGGIIIDYNSTFPDPSKPPYTTNNRIQGNFIGTDASGLRAVPNGRFGIEIKGDCSNNLIGGVEPGAGNVIAYHPLHGIELHQGFPVSGTGNAILGNSIYANNQLGIDLNGDGLSPNDDGDADGGPNNRQNYPVLDSADFVLDKVRIRGSLNSAPNKIYRIEFFGDAAADSSGFGEARVFLGATTITSGPSGLSTFEAIVSYPAGTHVVAATATDPDGNTSEFSRSIPVSGSPAAQLLNISSRARVATGDNVLIAGVIVGGPEEKKVVVRALGPSLLASGLTDVLSNPVLALYDSSGAVVAANDDWKDYQENEIRAAGLPLTHDLESAIIATIRPSETYTAVVQGNGGGSGIAVVEAYAVDPSSYSQLLNISTRALVSSNDGVLIGGLIAGAGAGSNSVLVRALGPSLKKGGVVGPLLDPLLELRDENGGLLGTNDDWKQTQMAEIIDTGLAPTEDAEAAFLTILPPGKATVVVRGKNESVGVGLVEIYDIP